MIRPGPISLFYFFLTLLRPSPRQPTVHHWSGDVPRKEPASRGTHHTDIQARPVSLNYSLKSLLKQCFLSGEKPDVTI